MEKHMPVNSVQTASWAQSLQKFFYQEDAVYDKYEQQFQAKTPLSKAFYISMHFVSGIFIYVLINIQTVYEQMLSFTGWDASFYQMVLFLVFTFVWYIFLPVALLRGIDKLSFRQTLQFLSMDRIDWWGMCVVLPVYFLLFCLLTLPFMKYFFQPLHDWLASIPAFAIPERSIFSHGSKLYNYPPLILGLMFIGNFLGEELYFRGYLLKKAAFLGKWNILFNSVAFAIYHFWQIPQTWPLLFVSILLTYGMQLRKNLWFPVIHHALINTVWAQLTWMMASQ